MYKEKILIIDYNELASQELCEKLRQNGFENIFLFTKTKTALEKIDEIKPDLIISEINMHHIDGWQFCKILKSEEYRQLNDVPIVLFSETYKDAEAYHLTLEAGAVAFIQAPFGHDDIVTAVFTHLIAEKNSQHPKEEPLFRKIVIADDDPSILNILKFCLEENGYKVKTATDGEEAEQSIDAFKPHIVLLDYQMPIKDGMQVLQWIKTNYPEIAVVVLTAHGNITTAINFMKEGADDYLNKPFDINKIPDICDTAFKKYSIRQINRLFREKVMELKASEEKYRGIVNNSSDFIYTLNPDGEFNFVNQQSKRLLGFEPFEMLGISFKKFMNKDDIEKSWRKFFERRTGDRACNQFEIRLNSKNGEAITLEVNAQGLYSENRFGQKDFFGTLGIARDVSERNKIQEQLIQADKLSSIGTLVAGVAHELNNPLTSILGFTELLLEHPNILPSEKKDAELIHVEANRCMKIVQNLLTFARKQDMEKSIVSINKIVKSTLELMQYQLKSNNINLLISLDEKEPHIYGDFIKIQQVFLNILNNASYAINHFKKDGTITVDTFVKENKSVVVQLTNDGPKIETGMLNKIFDPFFTTKEVGKGTGLGLSLAHGIISNHSGTIAVENIPNGPVAFKITFPIKSANKESELSGQSTGSITKVQEKKILLVEDDAGVRDLMIRVLSKAKHTVTTASNGQIALDIARETSFDLIISDMKMPVMDGITFYNKLTEEKPYMAHKFIIMTGLIDKEVTEFSMRTGNHYIQKPFRQLEFNKLLSEIFSDK